MATNNRFITSYNGLVGVYYPSESGLVDIRTGQPYVGGGLYQGATSELTAQEALSLTPPGQPSVYGARYRFVAIDPGATAANLGFGKAVGWCPGLTVAQVAVLTAGSGQTPGTYTATASAGGAVIQYTISGAGTLLPGSATLLSGGTYASNASLPTFTIAAGGTPATVAAQWALDQNTVTSMDVASSAGLLVRGVALGGPPTASDLANPAYMWIVENGKSPVLGNATIGSGAAKGMWVNSITSSPDGTVNAASANVFTSGTLGYALDLPVASALFRVELSLPNFGG
jgi:hypothetical protein